MYQYKRISLPVLIMLHQFIIATSYFRSRTCPEPQSQTILEPLNAQRATTKGITITVKRQRAGLAVGLDIDGASVLTVSMVWH
jgi:hypothetical protein